MNQDIQVARFNALLGRLLSMSGMQNPAGQLSPEISPILGLEIDRPEWGFLSGEKRMGAGFGQAADVANPTFARIRNPVNSGVLAVVRVAASFPAAAVTLRMSIGVATTDRANVKQTFPTDSRWQVGTGGALVCSSDNTTFAGNTVVLQDLAAGLLSLPRLFVLAPGSHVDIGESTVNLAGNFVFDWTERPMELYEGR